jgi:flagellar biosynthetic protein FliQ
LRGRRLVVDDIGIIVEIGRRAMLTGLTVSAPLLVVGFVVGLVASALQTATQIHETSLVFMLKMVAMMTTLFVFAPWMLVTLAAFTHELFDAIPALCG